MERIVPAPGDLAHEVEVSVPPDIADKKVGKHALFAGITTRNGKTFVSLKRAPTDQEADDIRKKAEK